MPNIQDLLAKRAELDKQIADARRNDRSQAITKIRALMAEHGLTAADLAGKATGKRATKATAGRSTAGTKVAPKYRNKATGDTWTGRGLQPKWLRAALAGGKKIDDFLI